MSTPVTDIRDAVYTRIALQKALGSFVNNDFTLEKTWYPYERLEAHNANHPNGKVYVIGQAPGEGINQARSNKVLRREYPVQVGLQITGVNPADDTTIDTHVQLVEELDNLCIQLVDPDFFSFLRLEYMADDSGLPLSFMGLREFDMFEAYFTAYYNFVVTP